FISVDATIAQSVHHATTRTVAVWRCDVMSIRAHAVAGEFAVNAGATFFGVFVLFQYQHTSALTQHKAVAVHIPGTRCRFRIVVTGGQSTHGSKTANAQRGHGGLG